MRTAAVLLSVLVGSASAEEACAAGNVSLPLSFDQLQPSIVAASYAVRGRLLDRAGELEAKLKAGESLPFKKIVKCNIGNPQALGQKPLSHVRRTLSLLMNPELVNRPPWSYPKDVVQRAKTYLASVPSVGAYSDSQGLALVRQEVAQFISDRDGHPASPADIFLTDGASAGVKALMQLMIRGPHDAVLAPIPQYPLYSAATTMLNGTLAGYYLDEASSWGVVEPELRKALQRAVDAGATARALVVINPGNPTGQSLPKAVVEMILRFAAQEGLVLMADEVYQENVYGDAPKFTSFKQALVELRQAGEKGDKVAAELAAKAQVISFHSTSKGFIGECGLRGGYFELQNVADDVRAQITKLASVSLCSNVVGQFTTGLMVRPPRKGEASYKEYVNEKKAILDSLAARAASLAKSLDALPGISCNSPEGAMYLFPQIMLPQKAIDTAKAEGVAADEWYALKLLDATGLVVVPGSGFGQQDGTWHFRTTFLPQPDDLKDVLGRMEVFQKEFMATWGPLAKA